LQKGSAIESEARLHPGLLDWTLKARQERVCDEDHGRE